MFKEIFLAALTQFTASDQERQQLLDDVLMRFSSSSRHYHNLHHLDHLVKELQPIKDEIKDWSLLMLAIVYHDIIYNTLKQNNEEKSAVYARKQLKMLLFVEQLNLISEMIMATKTHVLHTNADVNYFTDADLSILGADVETYSIYTKSIRKEYWFYPDAIYNPGRQKVLQHFLQMNRIFKTDFFYNRYESSARQNLLQELMQLRDNK